MCSKSLHQDIAADKALHEDIATETFEQCENLMYQYVWKFFKRYGGDFNDWISEGHVIFMKCLQTYNNKYAFTTWFAFKLQMGFLSVVRQKATHPQPQILYDIKVVKAKCPACHTTFSANYEYVSDQAWTMWQMLLYPPRELNGEIDNNDPDNSLDAIIWYCTTKLQWTKSQVLESLTELWECSRL